MMKPAKLEAAPVSVRMPMMTPTMLQATPTGSACLRAVSEAHLHEVQTLAATADEARRRHQDGDDHEQRMHAPLEHRRASQSQADPENIAKSGAGNACGKRRAQDQHGRQRQTDHSREHRREAVEQHADENRQRQDQVPLLANRLAADWGIPLSESRSGPCARPPGEPSRTPSGSRGWPARPLP
jgi:hypothetical protein